MTLTLKIITDAYRESNLIALGAEPKPAQVTEALDRLNVIVSGVYGFEVGEPLVDWRVGNEDTARPVEFIWDKERWSYPPANVRLVADSAEAQDVWLLPYPSDGARVGIVDPAGRLSTAPITIRANGRTIAGANEFVADVDNLIRIWLYRADLGEWVVLTSLTGDPAEEFPFPSEFDDFFITRLAMRLNPRYGRSMSDLSVAELNDIQSRIRARYRQTVPVLGPMGAAAVTSGYGDRVTGQYGDRGFRPFPRWIV